MGRIRALLGCKAKNKTGYFVRAKWRNSDETKKSDKFFVGPIVRPGWNRPPRLELIGAPSNSRLAFFI
ncbi:hypothetical protein K9U39_12045 [Rhodoblastus acidophilus]|uniref:Uncharacterized protein n=1 Tax=Candidatus Rhodoblastus alkanivorans TaxID=2954117 RepID=A0ABS9Z9H4_9HYPH|nr:hypothetical protein [Candidatus Rhodoblastus alkanivorans]MCI4679834.1 hypothetical protein [Candidatus Rhodoblastus alkanivorans]MCI4684340.1 hypothetical protein [Candidatus Rhodoblastus alkanivorans]MDI4641661.1 hypothetical protein [Rhodoblastus acidophilus]